MHCLMFCVLPLSRPLTGPFYRRPIGDNPPRYSVQVLGIHKLEKIVRNFCTAAGFQGYVTNHFGKVTCATELFRSGIDEQLIMDTEVRILFSDYVNKNAAKTFSHYIADSRREELAKNLASAKFFSPLMDGSTDKSNIDDELFLVLWCNVDGADEMVHTRMSYFAVARPETVTASGLFDTLQKLTSENWNLSHCKWAFRYPPKLTSENWNCNSCLVASWTLYLHDRIVLMHSALWCTFHCSPAGPGPVGINTPPILYQLVGFRAEIYSAYLLSARGLRASS